MNGDFVPDPRGHSILFDARLVHGLDGNEVTIYGTLVNSSKGATADLPREKVAIDVIRIRLISTTFAAFVTVMACGRVPLFGGILQHFLPRLCECSSRPLEHWDQIEVSN